MSDTTRKAVVTTAQVQAALTEYVTMLGTISGQPVAALEFDKGFRGRGFAVYTADGSVVDSFDTKEDAFVKYSNWVTTARQVTALIADRAVREQAEATAEAPKTTRKTAEKVSA